MGTRGQKRAEIVDELPADKRACSSLELRPSSSSSPLQTPIKPPNPTLEAQDGDMDTSSSASVSTRSEGEGEKDSAYETSDSDEEQRDNSLRDYQRRRPGDHGKFKRVLSSLGQEVDDSAVLAALTELCELLSFCTDSSVSSLMADTLSPVLVKLARHETNPNIMLLAIRAITYLCDVHSRSAGFLVRHDAIPALCQRLTAIDYGDVAEQCLQALEKISSEQPLACLQSGAIMAVLMYIEFFSTSVQRVALSTVVNICKKLPSECPSPFMEAVPILCNLLQYEDRQLVENAATCLIKIAERVCHSSDMLDELSKHGLIHQAIHLVNVNCRTTLCQPIYSGLLGLLVKLASGSVVAVRTLFELDISSILKDILSTYNLSHGVPSASMVDGHSDQVHEVLKLLNELLPAIDRDLNVPLNSNKEDFLVNEPNFLRKFGRDLVPILIEVVNSGANMYVCYGSLSVINKFVYFSKSEMLLELLKDTNISSFLAGVFTRKDQHVLMLALQIADTILQKLSKIFLNSFIKEGVFFAIDAILTPDKCSQLMFPTLSGIQLSNDPSQKSKDIPRCLCYAFGTGQPLSASETRTCNLEKDYVYNLAKQIKTNYFSLELLNPERGVTDILQKLRSLAAALTDLVNLSMIKDGPVRHEEEFYSILHQIMSQINGGDPISTFEFIESGIVKALVYYLSNAQYLKENTELAVGFDLTNNVDKRFEVFGRIFLSSLEAPLQDFYLSVLTRKLQTALSSVENFPVIVSQLYKQRNSYATVPFGRCMAHPCLRVQFTRGEGDTSLCDYSEEVLSVDPFSSLHDIESYLWPKVSKSSPEQVKSAATRASGRLEGLPSQMPSDVSSPGGKNLDFMESDSVSSDMEEVQVDEANIPHSAPEGDNSRQTTNDTTGLSEAPTDPLQDHEEMRQHTSNEDTSMSTEVSGSSSNDDASLKLLFYLEGQQLDRSSSLYQGILQQQIKSENDIVNVGKMWSKVYRVTYRRVVNPKQGSPRDCRYQAHDSSMSNRDGIHWQFTPFFSDMFVNNLGSDLEKSSAVYDVLFVLKSLEGVNRFMFQLMSHERMYAFAKGTIDNLDNLKVKATSIVQQNEFVSCKLTEKLEQQMRDPLVVSVGGLPLWCSQLMGSYPFLFSFEVKCKYFRLAAFGKPQAQSHQTTHNDSGGQNGRRQNASGLVPRKKFLVCRNRILVSAAEMMDLHARQKATLEVEYSDEVGTGLGPTLEFYTLVSQEFQKSGHGMWREDHMLLPRESMDDEDSTVLMSPCGLFPRPWSSTMSSSSGVGFSEVIKKFVLLGQVTAKALQDGRVLDIPFSKAFYKLILGQDLTVYDIFSFDPELGMALLEFQAVFERKKYFESIYGETPSLKLEACFRNTTIEDLCLDFTLPGYPDYILTSGPDPQLVNMTNLEEYVSLIVDATVNTGIHRQLEAFKSGFNQVFPIKHLQVFTEEDLERLLCGEGEIWTSNELLDHIKFDHGYTASSPPVVNLLEIIQEFDQNQQRAFLQFLTGAPRLPPGGLASLNPKLTIVRKHCSRWADAELPSVMTCANYLKLPPYSSKERMKEKILYAITEGQGSFHLS